MNTTRVDVTGQLWYKTWLRNTKTNVAVHSIDGYMPSIDDIMFDNRDMIICGSGPSLDLDINKLYSNSSCIIANHSNFLTFIANDIVPNFIMIIDANEIICENLRLALTSKKVQDALNHCDGFILPTHIDPEIPNLLKLYSIPFYFFISRSEALKGFEAQDLFNFVLDELAFDALARGLDGEKVVASLPQAGCVVNACVLLAYYANMIRDAKISRVTLSGCDFSYPSNKNHCTRYSVNDDGQLYVLDPAPIPDTAYHLGGFVTDPQQYLYYSDLRFIASVIKREKVFELVTSRNNFISDFLPVIEL